MDPTYQQLMAQQLMGRAYAPQGTDGQAASSPYGVSFMTGNQFMPPSQSMQNSGLPVGMLGQNAPSTVLQQPMQSYAGA